jgi:hypothetical protein
MNDRAEGGYVSGPSRGDSILAHLERGQIIPKSQLPSVSVENLIRMMGEWNGRDE